MNDYSIKFDKVIGYSINKELTDILLELFEEDIFILNEKTFTQAFIVKYDMKPSFSSCLVVCKCGTFDYEKNNYVISIQNSTISSIYCTITKHYLPLSKYCNDYKKLVFTPLDI
jgi:hypothetical protein